MTVIYESDLFAEYVQWDVVRFNVHEYRILCDFIDLGCRCAVSTHADELTSFVNGRDQTDRILNGIGDPTSYEESPSCLYQGLDKDYTYPGFKLRTYPENEVDYVLNVCFTDDSVATPEGIMLGSTRSEVINAYGSSFTDQNGNVVYVKGNTELRFRFDGDSVSAIEYWAIEQ